MLGYHLYKRAGFIKHYYIDEVKLCNYLKAIEAGYNSDNPYHNRYFTIGINVAYFPSPFLLCKFAASSIYELWDAERHEGKVDALLLCICMLWQGMAVCYTCCASSQSLQPI